ncbi:DUF6491 family protein [Gilvimarinus sp. SDUM040013]|uniref:DUF6491 family protein n=1 Tax=Gilvimarinus gilvus TaxID=3058038 RepID=A0ABU4S549_9GAMM|nr:DUF6491 family protein [Gilvimarinus sp. SDUM040013]MDO3384423.1 DUF6491 family protein [Gilvimarinus sp. SDUM040013]MDX6851028.1 DUF6491 family protein [Gilvimarinus sp. SDUM040013]
MNYLSTAAIASALIVGLSSCATQDSKSSVNISTALLETTGQNGRACVRASDIQGFGVLKDDVLSIDAFGNEYYLATVMPGCTDLGLSARGMFEERFGDVCGGGMNRVKTGSSHCRIRHIFEFKTREQAFAAHDTALEFKHSAEQEE